MRKSNILFCTALSAALVALSAQGAQAGDFRTEFPSHTTSTPMGVNLQTGKFVYFPYSFEMGPFVLRRGFGQSGFGFVGAALWRTQQTATGGGQDVLTVYLGSNRVPAVSDTGSPLKLDFVSNGSGGFIWWGSSSLGYKLARSGAGYLLTDRSGNTYYFSDMPGTGYGTPNARATLVTYADGSTISMEYDGSDRLKFIKSNRGYAVLYEYLGGGTQQKICGFNLALAFASSASSCSASTHVVTLNTTTLSNGLVLINSVIDLAGQTSNLTYVGNNFLQCMTLPNSATCEFTNSYGPQAGEPTQLTKPDQVRVQTDASGAVYNYGYDNPATVNGDDPPQYPGGPPILSYAWMNAPSYSVQGNYENGLLMQLSAPGGGPSAFEYDGAEIKKAIMPEGNNVAITRDWVGNAGTIVENPKPGSGQSAVTRTQTFPTPNLYANPTICNAASDRLCNKPITQIDALGNQTDYTYDPAHGGMLTKTLPAVAVAGSGSVRPQIRHEYAQRNAWVKNSGGAYVAESALWVKTRERSCKTTAVSGQSCAGGAADEVITDYEYGPNSGPNNLLLRGVAVTATNSSGSLETLRTCYGYDANGRKISETQPLAGLVVCP
ncbi:hypothetical protein [Sphingorhabdus contaminans]|uniref:hypothetical protein n=1 Tax=Sphingorhabdus contaminans TaxID=1343899 RepID=UPI003D26B7E1